jgi:hypothetical protein
VAHVQRAQPRALAGGQKVAALERRQLLAAEAGVAEHEHDRQVARSGPRIVGDPCLGLAEQSLVLAGG